MYLSTETLLTNQWSLWDRKVPTSQGLSLKLIHPLALQQTNDDASAADRKNDLAREAETFH